ncbi:hypothetical protein GGU10DRAFT_405662 [Lentinula aff. detonsa]|uniref:Asl1-like glycosyl hydrolase catalytic domain-containing protein n=1 Tax=Lentinula aff. detonsa TaxID=2804958 RepID=A0AA38KV07_9AGAR|nr:hypothetical protein GGU10DRAFT_405662 [Lentinula aff. detonsa]
MAFKNSAFAAILLASLFAKSFAAPIPRAKPLVRRTANAKRGIAFSDTTTTDLSYAANTAISWEYNWAISPPANLPSGIEHVPMQWGKASIENLQDAVEKTGFKYVLGFNEPEQTGQANITATDAASLWQQYMNPLSTSGIKIGGPAVSSAPEGKTWLENFLSACDKKCKIDFLPLHWYGQGSQYFLQYLSDMHTAFPDYNLWVTEFADTTMNNEATVQSFLTDSIQKMDALSYVERYSWFDYSRSTIGMQSNLLDSSGNLNNLGKAYVQ